MSRFSQRVTEVGYSTWNRLFTSSGMLAFAMFWIAIASGVFLALFYDINRPADSLELLTIHSSAGLFFRSLHYWSAQLFLLFSVTHVVEHLLLGSERATRPGIWIRLTLLIPLIFYVMISGFILKGDSESFLARRILSGLLRFLDSSSDFLAYSFVGHDGDWQILYMHHLATASLLILIFTVEHIRLFWPRSISVLYSMATTTLLSVLLPLEIKPHFDTIVKGPWYFLGLQEILHWLTLPWLMWIMVFLLALLFVAIRFSKEKIARILKLSLLFFFIVYIGLSFIGWLFRGENWQWIYPWS